MDLLEHCQVNFIKGWTKKSRLSTAIVPEPKRQKRKQMTQEDALLQQQKNINYFNNHFAVPFTVTPEEEKNNTVTVIPESHPKAIAEASVTNTMLE